MEGKQRRVQCGEQAEASQKLCLNLEPVRLSSGPVTPVQLPALLQFNLSV